MSTRLVKRGPGRPRKYGCPSRAATITLPEDVLERLSAIDADLGRAIVSIVKRVRPRRRSPKLVELAEHGSRAVIVVTPVRALKRLAGVQLVPIDNGRALISLDSQKHIPQLELDIRDALESSGAGSPEAQALQTIANILRRARSSRSVKLEERTIIVLKAARQRRSA